MLPCLLDSTLLEGGEDRLPELYLIAVSPLSVIVGENYFTFPYSTTKKSPNKLSCWAVSEMKIFDELNTGNLAIGRKKMGRELETFT